jgi:hypothetical protein
MITILIHIGPYSNDKASVNCLSDRIEKAGEALWRK